jgi:hypothetical protein
VCSCFRLLCTLQKKNFFSPSPVSLTMNSAVAINVGLHTTDRRYVRRAVHHHLHNIQYTRVCMLSACRRCGFTHRSIREFNVSKTANHLRFPQFSHFTSNDCNFLHIRRLKLPALLTLNFSRRSRCMGFAVITI